MSSCDLGRCFCLVRPTKSSSLKRTLQKKATVNNYTFLYCFMVYLTHKLLKGNYCKLSSTSVFSSVYLQYFALEKIAKVDVGYLTNFLKRILFSIIMIVSSYKCFCYV